MEVARGSTGLAWLYWLIPAAFVIHDSEELATMPGWIAEHRSELASLLSRLGVGGLEALLPTTFTRAAIAIGCVLALFVAVTAGVTLRPQSRMWRWLFTGLLGGFFLHGFAHVGQSIAFGGYTPGVVTAAVVVVPASMFVYRRLVAVGAVVRREAVIAATVAALLFVPAVILAMSVAQWLTSGWVWTGDIGNTSGGGHG